MTKKTKLWLPLLVAMLMVATVVVAACAKTATVTYVKGADGATGTAPAAQEVTIGDEIELISNPFKYEGHTFAGWSDGSNTYQAGAKYKVEGSVTFTALWTEVGGGEKHECKHICDVCKKCTDPNCTDSACADKCQGHQSEPVLDARTYFLVGSKLGWDKAADYTFTRTEGTNTFTLEGLELRVGDTLKLRYNDEWSVDNKQMSYGAYFFPTSVFEESTAWDDNAVVKAGADGIYNVTLKTSNGLTATTERGDNQIVEFTFTYVGAIEPDIVYHKVTFVANGEIFATKDVEHGHTVDVPETNPTHETKTFRHWSDGNGAFDFTTPINSDLELEASFGIYVTFDIDGATGTAPEAMWASPAGMVYLPDSTGFSKEGFAFGGWTDGQETYGSGSVTLSKSVNLKAIWNNNSTTKYTLSYFCGLFNGLPGETPADEQHAAGEVITLPTVSPWTRTGYAFAGWKAQHMVVYQSGNSDWGDIEGYTELAPGAEYTMPAENVRIVALWAKATVTVTYHSNDGSDQTVTDSFTYDSGSYNLKASDTFAAPSGKIFDGWAYTATGDTLGSYISKNGNSSTEGYDSHLVSDGDNYTLDLYAIWVDAPTTYDIADYAGVWTSGSSIVIISEEGADPYAETVGSIIVNNQYVVLWEMDGGWYGYTAGYDLLIEVIVTETGIQVAITDISKIPVSVDYSTDSKKALSTELSISDFEGEWERSTTKQKLTISAGSVKVGSASAKAVVIDEYIVITYNNGYQYILKLDGGSLVGYYTEPQKTPVSVTFAAIIPEIEVEPNYTGDFTVVVNSSTIHITGIEYDSSNPLEIKLAMTINGTASNQKLSLTLSDNYKGTSSPTVYYSFDISLSQGIHSLGLAIMDDGSMWLCDSISGIECDDGKFSPIGDEEDDPTPPAPTEGDYSGASFTYNVSFASKLTVTSFTFSSDFKTVTLYFSDGTTMECSLSDETGAGWLPSDLKSALAVYEMTDGQSKSYYFCFFDSSKDSAKVYSEDYDFLGTFTKTGGEDTDEPTPPPATTTLVFEGTYGSGTKIVKIEINTQTNEITITTQNMFGSSTEHAPFVATFENGAWAVTSDQSVIGERLWLKISEDGTQLIIYEFASMDPEDRVATFNKA